MNNSKANSGISRSTNARQVARACSVIIPLCFFSLLISLFLAFCANDMYAFVKPSNDILFSVTDISSNFQLSRQLRKNNIIKNDIAFALYLKSKGVACDTCALSGEWLLNSSMSYREIYAEMF